MEDPDSKTTNNGLMDSDNTSSSIVPGSMAQNQQHAPIDLDDEQIGRDFSDHEQGLGRNINQI